MDQNNDQKMKNVIKTAKKVKRTVVQKVQEEKDIERKEKMLESINNILNKKVDDNISALREGFLEERFNNVHLMSLLNQLQAMKQDEEISSFIEDQIYFAIQGASMELNSQSNGIYIAIGACASLALIAGGIFFLKRRR